MQNIDLEKIRGKHVYLYGAGKVGQRVLAWLLELDICPEAFLVTDTKENKPKVKGIPVLGISDYKGCADHYIIVAVGKRAVSEVIHTLDGKGIGGYGNLDEQTFYDLRKKIYRNVLKESGKGYFEDAAYQVESTFFPLGCAKDSHVVHFRLLMGEGMTVGDLREYIAGHDLVADFEKAYGAVVPWQDRANEPLPQSSTAKILKACSHLDKDRNIETQEDYIVPIQAGKALTDIQVCDLTDNTGDNISERNYNYCEVTAVYWAWKNGYAKDTDYIGLCHYCRKLDISQEQIKALKARGIDIVLSAPTWAWNLKRQMTDCTGYERDWDLMRQAVRECMPEYLEAFEIYEGQHFCCECNMFLMRRDLFDGYAQYLFTLLDYIEKYWNQKEPGRRGRYLAYLAENLLSVYVIRHRDTLSVMYADMLIGHTDMWELDRQRIWRLTMQRDRSKMQFHCAAHWLGLYESNASLIPYFRKHRYEKVAVYGAADLGRLLVKELKRDKDIEIYYFLDRNADKEREKDGIPVYIPQEYDSLPDIDAGIGTAGLGKTEDCQRKTYLGVYSGENADSLDYESAIQNIRIALCFCRFIGHGYNVSAHLL